MPIVTAKPYLDPRAAVALAAMPVPRKALFLDRDGVINVDHGYVHKPADTEWMPGIFEFCAKADRAGYLVLVVTNQSGIARGYFSTADFLSYTRWVHEQFASRGILLFATYHCPHHPEAVVDELRLECECRKPRAGMLLAAARDLQLSLPQSLLVGDKPSDLAAAEAAGVGSSVLVESNAALVTLAHSDLLRGDSV